MRATGCATTIDGHYYLHPREVAFCGYSGSGKTTLITRILADIRHIYRIGYFKHDAHRFEMDRPGKDTHRARTTGAKIAVINDARHWAAVCDGALDIGCVRVLMSPMDAVFIEGYKQSELPKIMVVDSGASIVDAMNEGQFKKIIACVGVSDTRPHIDASIPYFNRDNVADVAGFVLGYLGLPFEASEAACGNAIAHDGHHTCGAFQAGCFCRLRLPQFPGYNDAA